MTDGHDSTWRGLLVELFDTDMRERWGWHPPRSPRACVEQPVAPDACIHLEVGGLKVPYFNGWITIDFEARTVVCNGVDQKTPADERWDLEADDEWWSRASACDWPQR